MSTSNQRVLRGLLAGVLAWVVPGAGHLLVGARGRAAIFFVLMVLTVGLGLAFDGNLSVVDPRTPVLSRLQVATNLAIGPVEPVVRTSLYGALVYNPSGLSPSAAEREAMRRRRERAFATWSAYGTAYLLAAGLMNVLLVLDAWDIAIGRKE
ncbi:MAG: hypothetical protein KBD01_04630 [Acidobacteria bacterium]|nr:hypothetical protein [Acidobacteriota bacterium]